MGGVDGVGVVEHLAPAHEDPKMTNTKNGPDNLSLTTSNENRISGSTLAATLQPLSWNMIRIAKNG